MSYRLVARAWASGEHFLYARRGRRVERGLPRRLRDRCPVCPGPRGHHAPSAPCRRRVGHHRRRAPHPRPWPVLPPRRRQALRAPHPRRRRDERAPSASVAGRMAARRAGRSFRPPHAARAKRGPGAGGANGHARARDARRLRSHPVRAVRDLLSVHVAAHRDVAPCDGRSSWCCSRSCRAPRSTAASSAS
jgi:hypothetical protein